MDLKASKEIVKKHITCLRFSGAPAYPHSRSVGDRLEQYGFANEVIHAGILHDIVEDANVSLGSLRELGYSDYIVYLVDKVSHDNAICDSSERRNKMMLRCIEEESTDVRAIKIADYRDNIMDFEGCSLAHIEKMLLKRAPIFIYYGNHFFSGTQFYNDFLQEYRNQMKIFHHYFI